jgi:hypothetical protein
MRNLLKSICVNNLKYNKMVIVKWLKLIENLAFINVKIDGQKWSKIGVL